MCCILMPEMAQGGRQMLSAKWIERNGINIAVSPADECVRLLSDPMHLNGIKSKGMWAKHEGRALVVQNDYMTYTMENVPPLLDYKVVLPKDSSTASVHTTTSTRTRTLAWIGQWCIGLPAAVAHARINSKDRGCCVASSPRSHAMG
jgi:hypothetical protein